MRDHTLQRFKVIHVKKIGLSLFIFLVIFIGSVENFAAVSCRGIFRDTTLATHYVEVLDGQFQMGLDIEPTRSQKNKLIYLDGISLSFKHSQRFANEARRVGIPLIRLDMVGVGNTLKRQWESQGQFGHNNKVPAELQAEAVIALIEKISSEPVILVGLSYGGGIAALVAKKRPDLIKNLALVGPFVVDLAELNPVTSSFNAFARFNPMANMMMQSHRKNFLTNSFTPFLPPYLKDKPDVYFDALFELSEGIRSHDLRKILKDIEVQTDILYGAKDRAINPSYFVESFNQLTADQKGRLTELEEAPHDLIASHPTFVAQWLLKGFYQ